MSKGHEWTGGGAIVSRKNPTYRMIFWEGGYISRVLKITEDMIGIPLDRMVIELARKASREYVASYIHPVALKIIERVALKAFTRNLLSLLQAYGFGEATLESVRYRKGDDDYLNVKVKNPYYLPSCAGTLLGGVEAVCGREGSVRSEEIAPGEFLLNAYISDHPVEFSGRLNIHHYAVKPGDIAYERCPSCGSPVELSAYDWDTERGIITRKHDGVRMALGAFGIYDALIKDLEEELGEHIPRLVVESARRFATEGRFEKELVRHEGMLRRGLALQGLGNLREYTLERDGMRVRLENACLPLIMAGTFQGFFEIVTGRRGEVEWDYADDGDLRVRVYT